jgi:predicted 2-oxoglutarate/Fe(II)-dependent dioxygenase YbiX
MCRRLIDVYEASGGEESGFMRDVGGKTRLMLDPQHKVRRDHLIEDPALARELNLRIIHRLLPMVRRAFSFEATRVERLLVGCYEAETGGHFRAHRDNTTKGTAHRRFAVTINLNAEEYEGGDLRFPEFGPRLYRATTGGAIVFGCSLLHEAMPVTKGRRFAFLPFLYDEAGAVLRERNAGFLEGDGALYRADKDVKVG